jgi:hypothetical protein
LEDGTQAKNQRDPRTYNWQTGMAADARFSHSSSGKNEAFPSPILDDRVTRLQLYMPSLWQRSLSFLHTPGPFSNSPCAAPSIFYMRRLLNLHTPAPQSPCAASSISMRRLVNLHATSLNSTSTPPESPNAASQLYITPSRIPCDAIHSNFSNLFVRLELG